MIVNANFRFLVNISLEGYKCKTDATACLSRAGSKAIGMNKMAFQEMYVTPMEFLSYATSGHTFCNIFEFDKDSYWITTEKGHFKCSPFYHRGANKGAMKLSFKADEYFKGAQVVFVDVDYTSFTTIEEYVDSIMLKPTAVYPSYSDNTDKHGVISSRFRLVYVFSHLLTPDEFCKFSDAVHEHVKLCTNEPMDDYCGTRPSQYMNGVYGTNEVYCTNCIYSGYEFPEPIEDDPVVPMVTNIEALDENLLADMNQMDYNVFMHKYSRQYRYLYRTETDNWTNSLKCSAEYQLTDENYLQLWYYREPVVDGEHRRRKLLKNACLRRLMFPEITANELLFNLYIDLHRFFDNSDDVITVDVLKRRVNKAMSMSTEELKEYCKFEIEYWNQERPKFIVKTDYCLDLQRAVNIIGAELRYKELDLIYNTSISVSENFASGMGVSRATLYRYCADRRIETSPRDTPTQFEMRLENRSAKQKDIDLFIELYDEKLSLRKLKEKLAKHGLRLSLTTIRKWIKIHIKPSEVTIGFDASEFTFTPLFKNPSSTFEDPADLPNYNNPFYTPPFQYGSYL